MLLGEETIEFYAPPPSAVAKAEKGEEFTLWDSDGFSFGDLLDVVNPLQHIPVVSTVYRDLTGDDIGHGPRVLGGALYGGAIGAAASLVNVLIDDATGKDIGSHVMAAFFDEGTDGDAPGGATELAATSHGTSSAPTAKPWINPDTQPRAEPLEAAVRQVIARAEPAEAPASPSGDAKAAVDATQAAMPPVAAIIQPTPPGAPSRDRTASPVPTAGPRPAPPENTVPSQPIETPAPPRRLAADTAPPTAAEPTVAEPPATEPAVPAAATPPPAVKRSPGALAGSPGRTPVPAYGVKPDVQVPFLHESMLSALDKYERLVRERKAEPGRVDLSG